MLLDMRARNHSPSGWHKGPWFSAVRIHTVVLVYLILMTMEDLGGAGCGCGCGGVYTTSVTDLRSGHATISVIQN